MRISTAQLLALDLVGPDDIAGRLMVKANTIATWASRFDDFPRAELVIGRVPIRRWAAVRSWAERNGRLPEVRSGQVTAEDLREAADLLPTVRQMLAREVGEAADQVRHLVSIGISAPPARARARGGRRSNDGDGNGIGEWDWYWLLPAGDRDRLRVWWSKKAGAVAPDQYAQAMGTDDVESAMAEWCRATALLTAAGMLARGQVPAWHVDAVTTYPLSIFGPDGAVELAMALGDERERYAQWSAEISTDELPELELEELF